MWLEAVDAPQDSQTAIILGVIGLLTAVLVAIATGVFGLLSARQNRTAPAPPSPLNGSSGDVSQLRERVAVLERRADDNDERDDIQDHRIEHIERAKDYNDPRWRDL